MADRYPQPVVIDTTALSGLSPDLDSQRSYAQ